jgi:4a-hydroxytetrahydrobiopterin dehydratase
VSTPPESWNEVDGALERVFEFDGFPQAIAFVNQLADLAQMADHHPDITINFNKVTVRWWTHTAGGITDRDRELAVKTSALV